jgi:copper(I)-binding protein
MRILPTIATVALVLSTQASAGETRIDNVVIHHAWADAALALTNDGAAYMTLEVTGGEADRLLAASTPAAEKAELRGYWLEGCFAHRRHVEAIAIAPGGPTVLDPGGPHVLLVGLKRTLAEGDIIALSLTFERAGTVDIEVPLQAPGRRPGRIAIY